MPIDYKKYPANWKDVIRPDILRREHYCCKFCKVQHKTAGYRDSAGRFILCYKDTIEWALRSGKRVFTIILTIAHLDQDITNNDYSNLAALCQKCHLNHDKAANLIKRSSKQAV